MEEFRAAVERLRVPEALLREPRTIRVHVAGPVTEVPRTVVYEVESCVSALQSLFPEEASDDTPHTDGNDGCGELKVGDASVLGRDVWGLVLGWLSLRRLAAVRCASRFFRDAANAALLRRLRVAALGEAGVAVPAPLPQPDPAAPGRMLVLRILDERAERAAVLRPHALRVLFLLCGVESCFGRIEAAKHRTGLEHQFAHGQSELEIEAESLNSRATQAMAGWEKLRAAAAQSREKEAEWEELRQYELRLLREVPLLGARVREMQALVEHMFLKFESVAINGRFRGRSRYPHEPKLPHLLARLDDTARDLDYAASADPLVVAKAAQPPLEPDCAEWLARLERFAAGLAALARDAEAALAAALERGRQMAEEMVQIRQEENTLEHFLAQTESLEAHWESCQRSQEVRATRVRRLAASRRELLENADYYVTRTLDRSFPAAWQRRVERLTREIGEQFPAPAIPDPEEAAAELRDPLAKRVLVRVERVPLQPPEETAVPVAPVPLFAYRHAFAKLAVQREGMMLD